MAGPLLITAPASNPTHVVGPATATDEAVARFDTTTGKLVQDSNVTVNDAGDLTVGSAGLSLKAVAGAPAVPVNGDMWIDGDLVTVQSDGEPVALEPHLIEFAFMMGG